MDDVIKKLMVTGKCVLLYFESVYDVYVLIMRSVTAFRRRKADAEILINWGKKLTTKSEKVPL